MWHANDERVDAATAGHINNLLQRWYENLASFKAKTFF
jgi:hypothetical protein